MSDLGKGRDKDTYEEVVDKNDFFNPIELKGKSSTPIGKNVEEVNRKGELLRCNECNYTCKRDKSLKNHILTKHDHHYCKEYKKKLPNFMQLLKHMAKHHNDEQNQTSKKDLIFDKGR